MLCDLCKMLIFITVVCLTQLTFCYGIDDCDDVQSLASDARPSGFQRCFKRDVEPGKLTREEVTACNQLPKTLCITTNANFNTLPLNFGSSSKYVRSLRSSTLMYLQ